MARATCAPSRPSWAARSSRWPRRCSGSTARASSCWRIPAPRNASAPASPPTWRSWWRRRRTRSRGATSKARARPPSKRRGPTPTTPRSTCCSAGSGSPRGGVPRRSRSCAARCGSIPCSSAPIACWATRSSPPGASRKRWSSGTSGSGSPGAPKRSWRSATRCKAPGRRRRPSPAPGLASMADDVKALSTQLAQDPDSLVFLRLGELLRQRRQLDAAHRVALTGLERHPHLADAHDLYARILADTRDYERAFDEWDMALRIAPAHVGALKGLAFLYFKVGDVAQAVSHLEAAQRAAPDDPGIAQALAMVRGGQASAAASGLGIERAPEPAARGAAPLEEARVFAGLEGAQEGLLLLDASGRVLGGALRDPSGRDVSEPVAAYLAGVSQEAARSAKLLGLGTWTGLSAEGRQGHVHLAQPTSEALLLVVRDRSVPMGRLAIIAQRAAQAAQRWLEQQG